MAAAESGTGVEARRFPRVMRSVETARRHRAAVAALVALGVAATLAADLLTPSYYIISGFYLFPLSLSAVVLRWRPTAYLCLLCLLLTAAVMGIQQILDAEHVLFMLFMILCCGGLLLLVRLLDQLDSMSLDLARRARFAEAVARVVGLSSQRADKADIVAQAMRSICEGVGAERGALLLREGDEWVIVASDGVWDDPVGSRYPAEAFPRASQALAEERVALLESRCEETDRFRLGSAMLAPLRAFRREVGVFVLERSDGVRAFTSDRVLFAENLAAYTATALENARLMDELEARQRDLSLVLASSLDFAASLELEDVLKAVETRLIDTLGVSSCEICEVDEGHSGLTTLASVDVDAPEMAAPPGRRYVLREWATSVLAVESPRPVVVDSPSDPRLSLAERRHMARRGFVGLITLQLRARDRVIGIVEMYHRMAERRFAEQEIALAEAVARFAGLAVDNAQLFAAQRDSAERNDRLIGQLQRLMEISLRLNRFRGGRPSVDRILADVVRSGAELLGAQRVAVVSGETGVARVHAEYSGGHAMSETGVSPSTPAPAWVAEALEALTAAEAGSPAGDGHLIVPLQSTVIGDKAALVFDGPAGTGFSAEDHLLANTLAIQLVASLTNTRAFQREYDTAQKLQAALRPQVPAMTGFDIAVRNVAATATVGGDFFDLLEIGPGRLMVALGDVCGKGIDAAAQTALVRYTLRAYVGESSPGESLARLNTALVAQELSLPFATLVVAYLDARRRTLEFAVAGHPRPMLLVGGRVAHIPQGGGLPVGIQAGDVYETHRLVLPADAMLVLFTDGVSDARRQGQPYGEARVKRLLRLHAGDGAQGVADALLAGVRRYTGGALTDDAAVVVVGMP